jgi:hypothetical protein
VLGSRWEVLLLDGTLDVGDLLARLANVVGCNVGVLAGVRLDRLETLAGVLTSQRLDLLGLLGHDSRGLLDLLIDEFLVEDVDEGGEEEDAGAEKSHTPHGDELDEVVGDESSAESL